jgi:hypothetical protein
MLALFRVRRHGRPAKHSSHTHRSCRPWLEKLDVRILPSITVSTGFDGLANSDTVISGFSPNGYTPPDDMVAVGPANVVETVNTAIGIYDKAGNFLSKQALQSFFAQLYPAGFTADLGDPGVSYDEQAGRFVVGVLDFGNDAFDLAVSSTSDPTGGWEKQQISLKEKAPQGYYQADFTRIGWNNDAYVAAFNMYAPSGAFSHVLVVGVQKASMTDGNPATLVDFLADRPGNSNFTLVPATMHGDTTGGLMWFVEEGGFNNFGKTVDVARMTYSWTKTGVTGPKFTDNSINLPAAARYGAPPLVTQPGDNPGGGSIDAGDSRFLSVAWRGGRLLATQTVGEADSLAHARWYEFTTAGNPALRQWGDVPRGVVGSNTYYPSVEVGPDGSLGLTFMESSPAEPMSVYLAGQSSADPLNSLQLLQPAVKAGAGRYTETFGLPYRAGDFSGIGLDPGTGAFWAVNEYANTAASNNWSTWVTSFTVSAGSAATGLGPTGPSPLGFPLARPRSSPRWNDAAEMRLVELPPEPGAVDPFAGLTRSGRRAGSAWWGAQ